jgi:predicted DNA-binding protein
MTGTLKKRRISVFLTTIQTERLKALKLRNGEPESVSIRRAIDEYLKRMRVPQTVTALSEKENP